jgi:copper(I)-binding protein
MIRSLATVALLLAAAPALLAAAPLHLTAPPAVSDAWVREAPPGAAAMAGYLTLTNMAERAQTLVGASSPQFREVQMHEVVEDNGMLHMVQVPKLAVPAKGKLAFAPGSTHLMLIGPKAPLKANAPVQLTLTFEGGGKAIVMTAVRPRQAPAAGSEHHDHH